MLDLDQKRTLEAKITSRFLADNDVPVNRIVSCFSMALKRALPSDYHFYLKGGNAISLLKNEQTTGDFDFQLVPSPVRYNTWPATLHSFDTIIINAMIAALQDVEQDHFDSTVFDLDTLRGFVRDTQALKDVSFDNVVCKGKCNDIVRIGGVYNSDLHRIETTYGDKTYSEIISDENYKGGRLEVAAREITNIPIEPDKGPMIYVNYLIPGFILYRMVYYYKYEKRNADGSLKTFTLKSEIIDVSVPRKGSAEVYISQGGFITHFRKPNNLSYTFDIPGWGYHFYENLNLLQEIALGISGSKHKMEKRLSRGVEAMNALTGDIPVLLKNQFILEAVSETEKSLIYAFFGALTHSVNDLSQFNRGRAVYNSEMINKLKEFLVSEESNRFKTAIASRVKKDALEYYTKFRLDKGFDPAVKTTVAVRNGFEDFKISYNRNTLINQLKSDTYRFISPFEEIDRGKITVFPIDYAVVNVIGSVYKKLLDHCRKYLKTNVKDVARDESAFLQALHCKGCVFYIIFQNCGGQLPPDRNTHITDLLQLCILESQRYGLAESYMAGRG